MVKQSFHSPPIADGSRLIASSAASASSALLIARLFQRQLEAPLGATGLQQPLTTIATEGHEMESTGLLVTLQFPSHGRTLPRRIAGSL